MRHAGFVLTLLLAQGCSCGDRTIPLGSVDAGFEDAVGDQGVLHDATWDLQTDAGCGACHDGGQQDNGSDPCSGVVCETPPEPQCYPCPPDGYCLNVAGPGACYWGTCQFQIAAILCPFGCSGASCLDQDGGIIAVDGGADECAGVVCDAPPPRSCSACNYGNNYCTNEPAATGTCVGGRCQYVVTRSICPEGCAGDRCANPCGPTCAPADCVVGCCGDDYQIDGGLCTASRSCRPGSATGHCSDYDFDVCAGDGRCQDQSSGGFRCVCD